MTSVNTKYPVALLAGLALVGTLAGCSSGTGGGTSGSDSGSDSGSGSGSDSGASGPYKDGTYEATGGYQSPNGAETLGVTITLEGDIITDVGITVHPTAPNVERFQGEFADGIAAIVVGKNIDEISVDKVSGSSLTGGGFNDAIEQIKAEAVA